MINKIGISLSIPRVLRNLAVLGSLISTLSSRANVPIDNVSIPYIISANIDSFQQETHLSDSAMALLLDLFGQEELDKDHSVLRFKFTVIYQTLATYPTGSVPITDILDTLVTAFTDQYTTLPLEEKIERRNDIVASLDEFVIEFLLDFYDKGKDSFSDVTNLSTGPHLSECLRSMLGGNTDNIFVLLTGLDAVGRQLSEVRRKPVESFVLTKQDNDRLIDAHFTDRPVLKLYLRYHTSISEFPNQEIVTSLRKKKNLNEETSSDLDVIAHWDLVSMGIREQMRIRGSSRADLELLEQIKKFHYQSFVQLVNTDPLEINKWLVAIFNTLQKRFPSYEKKLIKNAGSDFTILPKTTETIAAMMCHAIVHNKLPTYDETVALMADVNQGPYELSQLRDATQELYVHNEELARRDVVSELKDEQSQLLALMVDRVIDAIEYPKGGFEVQYILTGSPTVGQDLNMCGKNSCITIRNIVKAGGVQKPIRYIWPAEFSQIDSVISDGSIPVLRGDVIDVLRAMKKHHLGELLSDPDKKSLFEHFKKQLPFLAVKHNNSIFEIYFNTSGYVTKIHPDTGEKISKWHTKAHRAHVVLGPDGVWQAFDPHYNPAKGVAKKKGFPLDVFLAKAAGKIYKPKDQKAYEIIVNTAVQYGYLADDDVQLLAQGNYLGVSPDAQSLFDSKVGGMISLKDLEQYQGFVPENLLQAIDQNTSLLFELLEVAFPAVQYEILEELFLTVEEIKNPFVKSMVIGYLLQGDISGLEQELAPDNDPSGVLDQNIIRLLEESYDMEHKNIAPSTAGIDMGYTNR